MNESQVELTSKLEERVAEKLRLQGVAFAVHPPIVVEMFGKRRRLTPDFLVPAENLIIEVNGCAVHGCEECGCHGDEYKRWHDQVRIAALERAGYEVDVVWEHELDPRGSGGELSGSPPGLVASVA